MLRSSKTGARALGCGGSVRSYGGLKDSDRIFTNLYNDGDRHLKGALKRVSGVRILPHWRRKAGLRGWKKKLTRNDSRATGTAPRTFWTRDATGSSTR